MKNKYPLLVFSTLALAFCAQTFGQPADSAATDTNAAAIKAEAADTGTTNQAESTETLEDLQPSAGGVDHEAIVVFGRDVHLKAGDVARAVVVIGGNAKIDGKVKDAVVVIGGDLSV